MSPAFTGLTECQLLQGAAEGLREHEVDEDDLVRKEATVRDEVLPASVFKANGVDEGGEKVCQTAEELEKRKTVRTLRERPDLNHVSCVIAGLASAYSVSP